MKIWNSRPAAKRCVPMIQATHNDLRCLAEKHQQSVAGLLAAAVERGLPEVRQVLEDWEQWNIQEIREGRPSGRRALVDARLRDIGDDPEQIGRLRRALEAAGLYGLTA